MPIYHFNEIHAITVRANASRVFNAIEDTTSAEAPLFRLLLGVRSLPRIAAGRKAARFRKTGANFGGAAGGGFVLLAEQTDRGLVIGWIGQIWKLAGGVLPRITNPHKVLRG